MRAPARRTRRARGLQDDGLLCAATAWRCLFACRHTVLSHVLTHTAWRGAARYNGEDESTLARGRQHAGAYGVRTPGSSIRHIQVRKRALLRSPDSRSRVRSRVRCARECERKKERVHICVSLVSLAIVCATPVHKSVGSPPSGATLHLLLSVFTSFFYLPARSTHMCMCTLVFSVRSEPAENARYCYIIIIVIVRSRLFPSPRCCREYFVSTLVWYREGDSDEKSIPDRIRSIDTTRARCMYRAPGVNERNVWARIKRAARDPCISSPIRGSSQDRDMGCVPRSLTLRDIML